MNSIKSTTRSLSKTITRATSSWKWTQNKYVLYVVMAIALFNAVGYVSVGNFTALAAFILIAIMASYLTKNMILILLSSVLLTNLFVSGMCMPRRFREGMENKEDNDEESPEEEEEEDDEVTGVARIDEKASKIESLQTIQNVLGKDGIKAMTKDTKELMENQQDLLKTVESMAPMVGQLTSMMETMQHMKIPDMGSIFGGGKK
jgi:biopolymer transport protein ExbB/TolQ